jgi:hypothetical protein
MYNFLLPSDLTPMDEFRVDLPLLFEIGSMRRIVRAWSRFMGK